MYNKPLDAGRKLEKALRKQQVKEAQRCNKEEFRPKNEIELLVERIDQLEKRLRVLEDEAWLKRPIG